jgi:hypothetical protein
MKFADLDGSGGTLNVGWIASADAVESADATGFASAVDVTSAGVYDMFKDAPTSNGQFKQFSSECQLSVATSGDTDATSGTVHVVLEYVID